jgi:hypothetical protein
MSLVYTTIAALWSWLCWKNQNDLLPIQVCFLWILTSDMFLNSVWHWQYYLSSLFGLLVIEMVANWGSSPTGGSFIVASDLLSRLLPILERTWQGDDINCISYRWCVVSPAELLSCTASEWLLQWPYSTQAATLCPSSCCSWFPSASALSGNHSVARC